MYHEICRVYSFVFHFEATNDSHIVIADTIVLNIKSQIFIKKKNIKSQIKHVYHNLNLKFFTGTKRLEMAPSTS